ncbi:MAG: heme exporter protein CcmB [Pseudomonadota bacterium]|nr:heme exporter protein CcmB [Pseudomonadota bacterium]
MRPFLFLIRRDILLSFRQGTDSVLALLFLALVVILFPLGLNPEPEILQQAAAGVIWVAVLLSALLSFPRLFQDDYADGSLDLLFLSPLSPEAIALAKTLAHWLVCALPVLVLVPLLALMYGLPLPALGVLVLSLLAGTPAISFTGSVGAALILGARQGGILLGLLILPLYIPVMIFGTMAVDAALAGQPATPHLLLLASLSVASMVLSPLATAAALRQTLE